jgi:hypothetical protein
MYEPNRRGEAAREGGKQSGEGNAPLADREVPLPPVTTLDHVHRWLEFWRRMEEESDRRRRVVTPTYLADRIMAALPQTASATAIAPWWKKDMNLSPMAVVALAVGAFSLGLIAMRLVTG